ncbi:unnamed protein product [Brachionus calyciflorus]|uniref:Uncharacterized protein n=1 Tax=Brachionus calyciflorus TaxID=104777 RepID=A0A814L3Z8_9BILA|nr:unnamed protein product [Brachionus calyciflorus]
MLEAIFTRNIFRRFKCETDRHFPHLFSFPEPAATAESEINEYIEISTVPTTTTEFLTEQINILNSTLIMTQNSTSLSYVVDHTTGYILISCSLVILIGVLICLTYLGKKKQRTEILNSLIVVEKSDKIKPIQNDKPPSYFETVK